MMEYTCYDCGKMVECETCGHEEWREGVHYDLADFTIEQQERFVYFNECCVCGGIRVEQ